MCCSHIDWTEFWFSWLFSMQGVVFHTRHFIECSWSMNWKCTFWRCFFPKSVLPLLTIFILLARFFVLIGQTVVRNCSFQRRAGCSALLARKAWYLAFFFQYHMQFFRYCLLLKLMGWVVLFWINLVHVNWVNNNPITVEVQLCNVYR